MTIPIPIQEAEVPGRERGANLLAERWHLPAASVASELDREVERAASTEHQLTLRVHQLFSHFNRCEWEEAYGMIDPEARGRAGTGLKEHIEGAVALMSRSGQLEVVSVDIERIQKAPSVLFGDRGFAYVKVVVRPERLEQEAILRGPWVLHRDSWYTRSIGWGLS